MYCDTYISSALLYFTCRIKKLILHMFSLSIYAKDDDIGHNSNNTFTAAFVTVLLVGNFYLQTCSSEMTVCRSKMSIVTWPFKNKSFMIYLSSDTLRMVKFLQRHKISCLLLTQVMWGTTLCENIQTANNKACSILLVYTIFEMYFLYVLIFKFISRTEFTVFKNWDGDE